MTTTRLRVIYGDTDEMGVVYYANFLRYFEAGRAEHLRAVGIPYRDFEARFGLLLPVVEAHVEYRTPARYDDLLDVEASVVEARRATVRFAYRILRDGTLVASGHTVHACMDPSGRARRLPAPLADLLGGGAPPATR